MKVKRFKNLWLMGLIIFGTTLGVFYLLKLIVPEFVVELAQVEPIVNFGNFVQGNIFLYSPFLTLAHLKIVSSAEVPRKLLSRTIRRKRRLSVVEI